MRGDPQKLTLREDFIARTPQHDPDRAAEELAAFEEAGGDAGRVPGDSEKAIGSAR